MFSIFSYFWGSEILTCNKNDKELLELNNSKKRVDLSDKLDFIKELKTFMIRRRKQKEEWEIKKIYIKSILLPVLLSYNQRYIEYTKSKSLIIDEICLFRQGIHKFLHDEDDYVIHRKNKRSRYHKFMMNEPVKCDPKIKKLWITEQVLIDLFSDTYI